VVELVEVELLAVVLDGKLNNEDDVR